MHRIPTTAEKLVQKKNGIKAAETVIDYLGRYTHRVALTNDRIVKMEGDRVTFRYRDREDGNKVKTMSLDVFEFIRRILLHVLPDGFMKIRHYGILSNRNRKETLLLCKELLGIREDDEDNSGDEKEKWEDLLYRITGVDPRVCPFCEKGKMIRKEMLQPRRERCPP